MMRLSGFYPVALTSLAVTVLGDPQNYNCMNQPNICSNICYWQTCVQPGFSTLTRDSVGADYAQRRVDCGVDHNPRPCTIGLGAAGSEADEFPFASTTQGGRTPYGQGSSILCVPAREQRVQGGVIVQIHRNVAQGADYSLALQNTDGISWCDPNATPDSGCNSIEFSGFHYFPDQNVYCQWAIDNPTPPTCVDGEDGSIVDPPDAAKLKIREIGGRQANFTNLLHIREPELVARMKLDMLADEDVYSMF